MRNFLLLATAVVSLAACATSGTSQTLDPNNSYHSNDEDSPNVGSRAYSGAQFPSENELTPANGSPAN